MGEVLEGQLDFAVAQAPVLLQPLGYVAAVLALDRGRHFESQGAFRFFFCDVALDRLLQFQFASLLRLCLVGVVVLERDFCLLVFRHGR